MTIELTNISKRFNREWIFRNVTRTFEKGKIYALTGPNGSGKSTLLQILSGYLIPSKGSLKYFKGNATIHIDDLYNHLVIVAPYLDLIEDFDTHEAIDFHFQFKKIIAGVKKEDIVKNIWLEKSSNKFLKDFSTGMLQRLKLAFAFYSEAELMLLDEPASNLDKKGLDWYKENVLSLKNDRTTIICSNRIEEYEFCDEVIDITDFKS